VVTIILNSLAFCSGLYGWLRNKAIQDRGSSAQNSQYTGRAAADAVASGAKISAGDATHVKYSADMISGGDNARNASTVSIRQRIHVLSQDRSVIGQLKLLRWYVYHYPF
jgi:hypothetical protein